MGECSWEPSSRYSSTGLGTPVQLRGTCYGTNNSSYNRQTHNLTYIYCLPLIAEHLSFTTPPNTLLTQCELQCSLHFCLPISLIYLKAPGWWGPFILLSIPGACHIEESFSE